MGTPELRIYGPDELRRDGYPKAWPEINAHVVELAGARCLRCGHPYVKGTVGNKGEWSACDERCTHAGPIEMQSEFGDAGDPPWYDPDRTDPEGAPHVAGQLVADGYSVIARWRILTVHHLNMVKADCRWWNLLPLDQRCHLYIQSKVKPDRPYPWSHSEWFRPFVAGFYAAKYLGADLTREETEARLDELLALGARMDSVERLPV